VSDPRPAPAADAADTGGDIIAAAEGKINRTLVGWRETDGCEEIRTGSEARIDAGENPLHSVFLMLANGSTASEIQV
jgi:hypothetical protein